MTQRTLPMLKPAHIIFEDGVKFSGYSFGSHDWSSGEVVFNTSMTGYQEMLTDPSYAGQIVVATYPLMGNYGINDVDFESQKIQVAGLIVRDHCLEPSGSNSSSTLHEFLSSQNVPAVSGVDTRAITRHLRNEGVMMGYISQDLLIENPVGETKSLHSYGAIDYVSQVTTSKSYSWPQMKSVPDKDCSKTRILVSDYGLKYNILRILESKGCEVLAVPSNTSAAEILEYSPDGVILSPGPGDPQILSLQVETAKAILSKVPILGICLGNQVLARAFGGKTFKLKFGHRGANHPVRDIESGAVHITAQNHGYAIDPDTLPADVEVSHINLNDFTVEGIRHKSLPVIGIQYHSEASPGPRDNEYVFNQFLEMVEVSKR